MTDTWFGPTVGVHQVRRAVQDVLRAWLPVALVDMARQDGWDDLERRVVFPRSWHRLNDYRDPSPDQLPNVAVASSQIVDRARRSAREDGPRGRRGGIDLTWEVNVAALVRGTGYEHTADLGGLYTTAVAVVVEQHLRSHPLVGSVEIPAAGSELYDGAGEDEARTLALGVVRCLVTVPDARSTSPQASAPPDDPFAPAPPAPPVATTARPTVKE